MNSEQGRAHKAEKIEKWKKKLFYIIHIQLEREKKNAIQPIGGAIYIIVVTVIVVVFGRPEYNSFYSLCCNVCVSECVVSVFHLHFNARVRVVLFIFFFFSLFDSKYFEGYALNYNPVFLLPVFFFVAAYSLDYFDELMRERIRESTDSLAEPVLSV